MVGKVEGGKGKSAAYRISALFHRCGLSEFSVFLGVLSFCFRLEGSYRNTGWILSSINICLSRNGEAAYSLEFHVVRSQDLFVLKSIHQCIITVRAHLQSTYSKLTALSVLRTYGNAQG